MNATIPTRQTRNVAESYIDKQTPEAEQRLLTFVEDQIEKMRKYAKFEAADGQPGFFELNRALGEHQIIWLGLVTLSSLAKVELMKVKEKFEDWFAEKYIEKREELNPRSLASAKWYSTKEIEMYVRIDNKEEYKYHSQEVTLAEQKVAIIRRLMEGWQTQHFNLSRLSRNVEAEFTNSKMEDINF